MRQSPDPQQQTPIVLLHSLGTDATLWHHQIRLFERIGPPLAPESRGHGAEPWPGTAGIDEWVADLHAVIGPLGPVHLVGLSMGGMQAIAYAANHPDCVRSLVVANAFAYLPEEIAERRIADAVEAIDAHGMDAYAHTYLEQTLTTTLARSDYGKLHAAIASMSPEAYQGSARATFLGDVRPFLPSIECPTLVLTGDQDQKTPMSSAELIASGIRGARVEVVERAGHLSCIENPFAFNREVVQFIRTAAGVYSTVELGGGM